MRPTLLVLCATLACTPLVQAQSLGQAAAAEAARRKAIQKPARVITADDIKPADAVSNPTEVPPFPDTSSPADPAGRRVLVSPAKLAGGALPIIPVMAIAGGEVFLEVDVTRDGGVSGVKAFRTTPPFTDTLSTAVRGWRFAPAQDAAPPEAGKPIDPATKRATASKVLVVGVFRPPSIYQGSNAGEPPKNTGAPSDEVAAPASGPAMPDYPPQALFNGVVLVELGLQPDGSVASAKVIRGAAPFDALALASARSMSFRPPRVHGQNVATNVYVAVGFRQPVQ
ncbi:MAG: TonB family protein [Vicinamibacterales bacterium]